MVSVKGTPHGVFHTLLHTPSNNQTLFNIANHAKGESGEV